MIVYDEIRDVTPEQWESLAREVPKYAAAHERFIEIMLKEGYIERISHVTKDGLSTMRIPYLSTDPHPDQFSPFVRQAMDTEPDYITISPILHSWKVLVVIMHYERGEYIQKRVSDPKPPTAARALAEQWATKMKLEIR